MVRKITNKVRRAKRTAAHFSFYVVLIFLMFHKGLHSSNNDALHVSTREYFMNASRVHTYNRTVQRASDQANSSLHVSTRQDFINASRVHGSSYNRTTLRARDQANSSSLANVDLLTPDESFWLQNLDASKPVQCGANKCFFELKGDSRNGYLLSPKKFRFEHRNSEDAVFQTLTASYELGELLRREYGMDHFLLTPPINISVSEVLAKHLNSNIWSEARGEKITKSRFKKGKTAFAQKVLKAPQDTLIFGCTASKRGQFSKRVEDFVRRIDDKENFARNFVRNMAAMRWLLKQEPCLFIDFHALISASDGRIYHLDLDRCFSNTKLGQKRKKKVNSSCLGVIDKVERQVLKLVNESKKKLPQ